MQGDITGGVGDSDDRRGGCVVAGDGFARRSNDGNDVRAANRSVGASSAGRD